MSWIVAILLALPAIALAVIALPFHARVRGGVADGELSGAIGILWAFGLVGVELWGGGFALRLAGLRVLRLRGAGRRQRAKPRPRRRERKEAREERRTGPVARLRAVLANRGRLLRMASWLAGTLHLRLRLRGRVGTGDPADTAVLAALIQAARALPGLELDVAVDWLDEVLELEAQGSARVWLPEVLAVAGVLFLRRGNRVAVRALAG